MSTLVNRRRDPKAERNPEKEAYAEKPLYSFIKMALPIRIIPSLYSVRRRGIQIAMFYDSLPSIPLHVPQLLNKSNTPMPSQLTIHTYDHIPTSEFPRFPQHLSNFQTSILKPLLHYAVGEKPFPKGLGCTIVFVPRLFWWVGEFTKVDKYVWRWLERSTAMSPRDYS
jgi:hypothetical protein